MQCKNAMVTKTMIPPSVYKIRLYDIKNNPTMTDELMRTQTCEKRKGGKISNESLVQEGDF